MLSYSDFKEKQIVFALLSRDDKLSFKNDNLVLQDAEGNIKHQSSCYLIFALFIVGHITITSGLLQRAKKFSFRIILLTHNLGYYGCWNVAAEGNVLLRKKQYAYNQLDIGKHIVLNKIEQQLYNLKLIRNKSDTIKNSIKDLKSYHTKLLQCSGDLQIILGLEGIAARVYFSNYFAEFNWTGRKPRVKHDITNVLLDIGYTLLFNTVEAMLNLYGFDVYQGVYHQVFYQRKSLACDLIEPFRPIVDRCIRRAYQLKQIKSEDFSFSQGQYKLNRKINETYVTFLVKDILNYKQEIFFYIQDYYRAFMRNKTITEYPNFSRGE